MTDLPDQLKHRRTFSGTLLFRSLVGLVMITGFILLSFPRLRLLPGQSGGDSSLSSLPSMESTIPDPRSVSMITVLQSAAFTVPEQPEQEHHHAIIGQFAPDFTLRTLDGGEVTLSDFRGEAVLINFWASWCLPCRLEMPDLVRAYEAHKDGGFVILGVNLTVQDAVADVKVFVDEFRMTFPILLDETGEVTEHLYQLPGLPMSIFIDQTGIVTRIYIGPMTGAQIDEFVGEILE